LAFSLVNMKRHHVIIAAIVLGLSIIGLLLIDYFQLDSPATVTSEAKVETVAPLSPLSDSDSTATLPAQATDMTPAMPPSPPPLSWHEQVTALHGIGKLFGVGAEARMKQLQDFVDGLAPDDLPAAIQELQKLQMHDPTATGKDLRSRLLQRWVEFGAHAAASWTIGMTVGSDRQEALNTIAGAWAAQNFAQASAWAAQLPNSAERQSALENVADAVVYTDPASALKLADTFPAGATRSDIVTRAEGVWASKAPESAAAWAKQIPDENLREQAVAHVAVTWAERNPMAAGNLAINSLRPGPVQEQAVVGIVQRWALVDAPAATAWVHQFPESPLRQIATQTLAQITQPDRPPGQ
jgi:hypothetical protein